jgi:hypothetical protein
MARRFVWLGCYLESTGQTTNSLAKGKCFRRFGGHPQAVAKADSGVRFFESAAGKWPGLGPRSQTGFQSRTSSRRTSADSRRGAPCHRSGIEREASRASSPTIGVPGGSRTCDLALRRGALYPAELRRRTAILRKLRAGVRSRHSSRVPRHGSCGEVYRGRNPVPARWFDTPCAVARGYSPRTGLGKAQRIPGEARSATPPPRSSRLTHHGFIVARCIEGPCARLGRSRRHEAEAVTKLQSHSA